MLPLRSWPKPSAALAQKPSHAFGSCRAAHPDPSVYRNPQWGGVHEPRCPVFWCTQVPKTCALPGPAAPGIALRTSQGLSPAGPAHLCTRCRTQGHSCQADFLAKLLAQLCVWINYEICMSFTELQSNQSTLSGEELERGSALDCIKLRASTRLLNPALWGPQSLVSSGCGGRYPVVSSGKPGQGRWHCHCPQLQCCQVLGWERWQRIPGEALSNFSNLTQSSSYSPWGTYSPGEMSQPAVLAASPSVQPEWLRLPRAS